MAVLLATSCVKPAPRESVEKSPNVAPSIHKTKATPIVTVPKVTANTAKEEHRPSVPPIEIKVDPKLPKVSIIIDDVGLRRDALDVFWAINSLRKRLTWAIIPGTPHGSSLAKELHAQGETILFHIPMEPMDAKWMTASLEPYLLVSDDADKIRTKLTQRLAQLPADITKDIKGLSNHQGSRFSTNSKAMSTLMSTLKKHELFYVDSRTTADTVAESLAIQNKVPFARRHVFLDNVPEVPVIMVQLKELTQRALKTGAAIAIGHPYPQTASALAIWIQENRNILQVVPVQHLVSTP